MKTAAVICEFNPFHNGHKYLIDSIKSQHADRVVAIMSGNFVQRGDVAITDKYERAKAALQNGCDLVVELPTVYAVSSAELFAKGAVSIAKALGVDMLCFGVENNDISMLNDISDIFDDTAFIDEIKKQMDSGDYYAKAVSNATEKFLSKEHAELLRGSNNTLAIEYLKAIKGTDIRPIAIKRKDVKHDSSTHSNTIASASFIRELVKNGDDYSDFTSMKINNPSKLENIESAIMYRLKTMSKEELEKLPNANEGLNNRIFEYAKKNNYLDKFIDELKTHRYTYSRLRRLIICALIGINIDTVKKSSEGAKYIRVLGINDNGSTLLKSACLPVIAKVRQDYEKLDDDAKEMFDLDVRASEIFNLARNDKNEYTNDFSHKIIKI